jgi:hypothetical protein
MAALLQGLDRNRDGFLQPNEVPERFRPQFELAARRRGLDPSKPIPLNQLTATPAARPAAAKTSEEGASQAETPQAAEDGEPAATADSGGELTRLVPGFGVPAAYPPVPGFGPPAVATNVTAAEATRDGKPAVDQDSGSSPSRADAKLGRYARSLLIQYDKNKNGQLERDEWSRLRGNPQQADRNRDNILTEDELARYLDTYAKQRGSAKQSNAPSKGESASSSYARQPMRESVRFLRPHERLPAGLPEWFVRKDVNGDGQVSMSEFSASWTPGQRREFDTTDINRDGFIVPKECLRARPTR